MGVLGSRVGRLVAAGVCGVVIAGMGMSAASAAPTATTAKGATAATTSGPANITEVTNLTPYVWRYMPYYNKYAIAPPSTVFPGQTAVWSSMPAAGLTVYTFNDAGGNPRYMSVEDHPGKSGETPTSPAESYSTDLPGGRGSNSPLFHMAGDPDGFFRHFDAVWNNPITVSIDNAKDPATAARILNSEYPRATSSSFSVNHNADGSPRQSYKWSDYARASSRVINTSSEPATIEKGQEERHAETTTLGEEVTVSASAKVFGVAAKAALSVTSDQDWGTEDKFANTEDTEVDPGYVGWLNMRTDVGTVVGELKLTTPEGITFDITNVAINESAMSDVTQKDPLPPTNFQGDEEAYVPPAQH